MIGSGDTLALLRRTLDGAASPVRFFFRNDDVGWGDASLWPLLDLFETRELPLDLAVIPAFASGRLMEELAGRYARSGNRLRLHQHGWRHENHEPGGRKCEFGPSRSLARQHEDLQAGRAALLAAFGEHVDPIFTPPWNRCVQGTADLCAQEGFRFFSRNVGAEPLRLGDVLEIPVFVDWQQAAQKGDGALDAEIVRWADDGMPVGIMLHHAVMTDDCRSMLAALLDLLAGHDNAHCVSMMESVPRVGPVSA